MSFLVATLEKKISQPFTYRKSSHHKQAHLLNYQQQSCRLGLVQRHQGIKISAPRDDSNLPLAEDVQVVLWKCLQKVLDTAENQARTGICDPYECVFFKEIPAGYKKTKCHARYGLMSYSVHYLRNRIEATNNSSLIGCPMSLASHTKSFINLPPTVSKIIRVWQSTGIWIII